MKKVILLALAVILVAGSLFFFRFSNGLMGMYLAHKWAEEYPNVIEPLADLKDTDIAPSGQKVSYLGVAFAVPWTDLDSARERSGPEDVTLTFRSGIKMRIARRPLNEFVGGIFTPGHEHAGLGMACVPDGSPVFSSFCRSWRTTSRGSEAIFGREATQSDYVFVRKVMETTPDKIDRLGVSWEDLQRDALLLAHKGALMADGRRLGLFAVAGPNFKGFQRGAPKAAPGNVSLILFDDQGELSIDIEQDSSKGAPLSQADINLILQSLRREAVEPATEKKNATSQT